MAGKVRKGVSTGPGGKRYYNIRDLLGHWNKRDAKPDQMCPHPCCKGRRVHPANFPLILPKQLLREASEQELIGHYSRYANNGNARRQIEGEINRRERKERNASRAAERRTARRFEYVEEHVRIREAAEQATHGHMVNEEGRRRGISPADLFSMREDRARRYASRELLEYWQHHPRTVRSTRRQRDASTLTDYRGHAGGIYSDYGY